jgi:hypothetical protein
MQGTALHCPGLLPRRVNVMGCRVLVTVPACMEILALSPANRDWLARIRYAVFDEVLLCWEGGLGLPGAHTAVPRMTS